MECSDPPNFFDGTNCGHDKKQLGEKRCDWNEDHGAWGESLLYNTNITYECPEGYAIESIECIQTTNYDRDKERIQFSFA